MEKIKRIADTVHGNIEISGIEKDLISQHAFNRLHNIMQNSTAFLTYPSNQTKRFEHSLGVMHLGGEIFYNSIANAEDQVRNSFLEQVKREIKQINEDVNFGQTLRERFQDDVDEVIQGFADADLSDPLYKKKTPVVVKTEDKNYYNLILQSIRCAALLHDLGHPPFSHVTEFALNDVLNEVKKFPERERTPRQKFFFDVLGNYQEKNKLDLHEKIGNTMANRLLESISRGAEAKKGKQTELFYLYVHRLTLKILNEEGIEEGHYFFKNLHSIIASPLDCDRLDYVTRDLNNSGFSKGKIEYDRLLSSIRLVLHDDQCYFIPSVRILSTIEDFYSRYVFLYKYVIFHHRVIKTDQLLHAVIYNLSLDYLSKDCEEEDDLALPLNISGLWKPIKQADARSDRKYFNLITQWDDSWLLTVLRQIYYKNHQESEEIISKQLEEILANKKYYHSVIKRMDDFLKIDEEIIRNFEFDWESVQNPEIYLKPLKEQYDLFFGSHLKWKKSAPMYGFFLSGLKNLFKAWRQNDQFTNIINDAIIKACSQQGIGQEHVLINHKELKTGLDKEKPLIHKLGNVVTLSEVSRMEHDLEKGKDVFPQFFVYLLLEEPHPDFFNTLLKDIGTNIGQQLSDYFGREN